MTTPRTSLLITLTGRDRPGVTSRLFAILAGHPLSVLDVEQVVIRGRLVLGVLLGCDSPPDLTRIHAAVSAHRPRSMSREPPADRLMATVKITKIPSSRYGTTVTSAGGGHRFSRTSSLERGT